MSICLLERERAWMRERDCLYLKIFGTVKYHEAFQESNWTLKRTHPPPSIYNSQSDVCTYLLRQVGTCLNIQRERERERERGKECISVRDVLMELAMTLGRFGMSDFESDFRLCECLWHVHSGSVTRRLDNFSIYGQLQQWKFAP